MKDFLKTYEKKNKITGIIALVLICLVLTKITYGISIVLLIYLGINKIRKFKVIKKRKDEIKRKHDEINKGE
ncbi:MAG: hypothetical protein E7311_01255 [Clostridiales bacterium]|nr:hypothetical protein [Clostridiales bacterium]